MPFTFSHPAIVLPLINGNKKRKIFSSTGLIVGCLIPDFESFIRFDQHKEYSHTWSGMFWFDLPLAVFFAFVFHNIVRDPLIKNLPRSIGAKFYGFLGFNWNVFFRKHFIVVIYSLLIGIASHLLWDAFTHLNLANPNATDSIIRIGPFRLYIILQYSCSVLGLIIVAWYILNYRRHFPGEKITEKKAKSSKINQIQYWVLAAVVACLTMIISISLINEPVNIILFIEIAISSILLAIILAPLFQRMIIFSDDKAK